MGIPTSMVLPCPINRKLQKHWMKPLKKLTNTSGLIDLEEFITAIRSKRIVELNLKSVFDKLGVKVDGVSNKLVKPSLKKSNVENY